MRAVLYIRVSDEEQAKEGFSIEAQQSFLKRKCAEWGYEIVDKPYIDDGYSAKDMRRPALQKMLKEKGLFDVIVFWRLDRFTRKTRDFQKIIEILEKNNCSFRSATEPYDTTTAIGRFQLELAISLGQLERETTAERVHFVMEERHRKGLRNGGKAPFGFDLVEGNLVINESEAEIGKRIYAMYRNGFTDYKGVHRAGLRSVAVQLNWEGNLNRGKSWNYNSVRYFLTNPANKGDLRWNYRKLSGKPTGNEIITESTHEGFISVEEFDYVQNLLLRRDKDGKKTTSVHPFSGVLKCGRCGYGMVGTTMKKYGIKRYYRCLKRLHYGQCDMPNITEESVLESFFESLDVPDLGKYIKRPTEISNQRDESERELAQIQKHKQKFQNMYMNDLIDMEQLKKEIEPYREREKQIQEQISSAPKKEATRWTQAEIVELIKHFTSAWSQIDNQVAKKNFLYDVFESIVINTEVNNPKGGPGNRVPVYVQDMVFRV